MTRYLIAVFVGILAALGAARLENHSFTLGPLYTWSVEPGEEDRAELRATIETFNQLYATFYDTGGKTFGLNEFPAENMVKRRIFQDIANWRRTKKWLMHDLHKTEFVSFERLGPGRAVVITRELWDIWLRDIETAERSGRRENAVRIRYHLNRRGGRWRVWEYEVFGVDDEIPPGRRFG